MRFAVGCLAGFLLGWYARLGPNRAFVARAVWHELERDPKFHEDLRRGEADLRAGRGVPWTGTRIVSNSTIRDQAPTDEPGGGW